MTERLLITGASGLLGATALNELRHHYETWGTYLRHPINLSNTTCFPLDISRPELIISSLRERQIRPTIILHTAAAVNVDECESDRDFAFRMNAAAPKELARFAESVGATLVHVSTDAFFEGEGKVFSEDDTPTPVNYYGETKLLGEEAVRENCTNHLILRTNLYGWNYQNKLSLAEWMYFNIKEKNLIPLVHDVYYSPVLTNTFIKYVHLLLKKSARGTFHAGGERGLSKLEFGQLLCTVFGLDPSPIQSRSVRDLSLKARRPSNMVMSIEKLRKTLGADSIRSLNEDLTHFKYLLESGYTSTLKGIRLTESSP